MGDIYDIYYKMNVPRDEHEDQLARERVDRWIFIAMLATIAIVPLLVGGHVTEFVSPLITEKSLLTTGRKGDIFNYYKFVFLLIATSLVVSLFLYKLLFLNYILPKRSILWFFFIFALGIVVSTVFAPYKTLALYGQPGRSDGALSYICYLLLMFVAMHIQYPKKAVSYVLYSLYPFVLINFTLSIMNFLGHDALTYKVVKNAITAFLPEGAKLAERSQLLGTLDQWNFMSGMFGVMTVMYLAWAIIDKHLLRRLFNLFVALISFAIVLMSVSTSGFLTIILLLPFLFFLAFKSSNKKIALTFMIVFLVASIPILHVLASKNPKVWSESVGFLIKHNPYEQSAPSAMVPVQPIKGFVLTSKVYAAENEGFSLPELPEPGVAAGSGRLYIWKKTLEITMDRFIVGYGLDTLPYHFPQDDIEKRAGLGTQNVVVDKPHNIYIGILYGTGIIGFIGFIGLVLMTLWKIGQEFWTFEKMQNATIVFGFAWVAYLIQSLFNDTLPGTAAPLWALAGIMLALMYQHEQSEKEINSK
ncbi:O-antigen ligase [Thermolongibacillus altinsuensis]|uniref:O-antigen ligase n=1 Tax=Thermolongibacillus altinsuensis TaxID=575256 RepID=A0A4R1QJ18_9BACL|nr:O-antigen ligase family protein [Thermolongibacillus altinsuensis]TCL52823.1 O-antigen ligase [Thermolongibacillus altinsuensis]